MSAVPFSTHDSKYVLRLGHQYAAHSMVTLMFAGMICDNDANGDKMQPSAVGREFHAMLSLAVSAANDSAQRAVRISLWSCPTGEDLGDTTHVGMELDMDNEAVLKLGTPTPFHFKELRAPPKLGFTNGHLLFPGMTLFVYWNPCDAHEVIFMPTFDIPLGYMQIIQRCADRLCPHRLAHAKEGPLWQTLDKPPVPDPPPNRPPPKGAVADTTTTTTGRASRKRGRSKA